MNIVSYSLICFIIFVGLTIIYIYILSPRTPPIDNNDNVSGVISSSVLEMERTSVNLTSEVLDDSIISHKFNLFLNDPESPELIKEIDPPSIELIREFDQQTSELITEYTGENLVELMTQQLTQGSGF